jgi:hypothetical protein
MKAGKIIFIFVTLLLVAYFLMEIKRQDTERVALDSLNLKLSGVVLDVKQLESTHGTGIILIKIINSNVDYYDPRSKVENYYCIIRNGIAEVYDGHAFSILPSDTVYIDSRAREIKWKNDKGKINTGTIWVNTDENFRNYVRERNKHF